MPSHQRFLYTAGKQGFRTFFRLIWSEEKVIPLKNNTPASISGVKMLLLEKAYKVPVLFCFRVRRNSRQLRFSTLNCLISYREGLGTSL